MKTRTKDSNLKKKSSGFSLPELLAGVTVISVFTTVGVVAINRQNDVVEDLQLQQHIKSLNAAAQAYEFSGGDLSDASTPEQVIARLKSTTVSSQKDQVAGLAGSMIDLRLQSVPVPAEEVATSKPRAIWDTSKKRFVYATTGSNGVAKFQLVDSAIPSQTPTETRKLSTEYAATDGWVWDYTDQSTSAGAGASSGNSSLADLGDLSATEITADAVISLLPPEFSVPSGSWEHPAFAGLELELTNPNASGSSSIYYKNEDGPWELYTGPINITPNSEISAFAQSIDPVTYADSEAGQETYTAIPQLFEGTAMGSFTNADGDSGMVTTNYTSEDGMTSTFTWGEGAWGTDPSSLTFNGEQFSAASDGNLFSLGTLDYFNGTIWSGTGADVVDLQLAISFTVPETEEAFTFDLELENTRNYGISADADADFVRIKNTLSQFSAMLNGIQYGLELQFGYEGDEGFATVDEFHVHEGSAATASLYGLFVAIDPVTP